MTESITVKPAPRKKQVSKKITESQKNIILFPIVKLLLLNFFITPLFFIIVVFLCHENINILLNINILSPNANESMMDLSFSYFSYFLFAKIKYVWNFNSFKTYVLIYRWIFMTYIIVIFIYNIRFYFHILKLSKRI